MKDDISNKKLIILGWDGATFNALDRMIEKGIMPNLKKIIERGVRSDLLSTVPPITGPSWASFRTGKKPENHGLFSFFHSPEEDLEPKNIKRHTAAGIDGISYWNILNGQGLKCIVADMPLTDPVEKIDGIMISGMMTRGRRKSLIFPESVLVDLKKKYPESFQKSITDGLDVSIKYIDYLIGTLKEKKKQDMFLMDTYKWNVFTTVYSAVDTLQHYFWNYMDENSIRFRRNSKFQKKIEMFFCELDTSLESYLGFIEQGGNIIIVSDHGFGPYDYAFYVNNFLKNRGYLSLEKGYKFPIFSKESLKKVLLKMDIFRLRNLIKKEMREKINVSLESKLKIDWGKTSAFFRSNNEYGIYLNLKGKYFNGAVESKEGKEILEVLITELRALKNEYTGEPVFENVFSKQDVYKGGKYIENAPDIILLPQTGLNIRGFSPMKNKGPLAKNKDLISGFHEKEGVFIAYGTGFKREIRYTKDLFIYDIAPLILRLFHVAPEKKMDGMMPREILASEFKSPLKKESYKTKRVFMGENDFNDDETMEQLRGLGYID